MASSEYLSSKSDGEEHPLKSATYTGIMYMVAVTLMVLPYLLFDSAHYLYALGNNVDNRCIDYSYLYLLCIRRPRFTI